MTGSTGFRILAVSGGLILAAAIASVPAGPAAAQSKFPPLNNPPGGTQAYPGQNAPPQGYPGQQGSPQGGYPTQGYPGQQQTYPGQGYPGQGQPPQGYPGQGQQQAYPGQQGAPQQGVPGGYPGQGQPQQTYPGQGYPGQQGGPQQGVPGGYPGQGQQAYPGQQGAPQGVPGGYPGQGQPQQGMPQQGMPQHGMPQQGAPQGGNNPQLQARLDALMAKERQDFGVRPTPKLHSGAMHGPTPNKIPGGQVVTTKGLFGLVNGAGVPYAVFDVLGSGETLPGALNAVAASRPGSFKDQTQQQFGQFLSQVTRGNRNMALTFYCLNPQCWMSYNAALRAINLGYRNVLWYRGGIEAWKHAGLPTQRAGGPMMHGQGQPGQGQPSQGQPYRR